MSIMSPFKNLQMRDTFLLELLILISHVLCIEFYLASNQAVEEYAFFFFVCYKYVVWAIISPDPSFSQVKNSHASMCPILAFLWKSNVWSFLV